MSISSIDLDCIYLVTSGNALQQSQVCPIGGSGRNELVFSPYQVKIAGENGVWYRTWSGTIQAPVASCVLSK
jgi:hypothetical protein